MSKQLAHLVLIISLVGQFLLSPAMAMPSLLHAFSHSQMSLLSDSELMPTVAMPVVTNQTQSNNSLPADADQAMTHGQQDCDMTMSGLSNNDGPAIDCDALCEMMGAGNCASHCTSATGILTQPQISLISPETSGRVQSGSWSTQTVELSSSNPPPKFEQA